MKIEIIENVMQYNKEEAEENRKKFEKNNVRVINILSAPGAGKTTLIMETIKRIRPEFGIGVIEGDISSTHDSEKIRGFIEEVVQINTGGTCHLNASMIARAIQKLKLKKLDIIFIENVGNLICPVGFDLGEDFRILVSSVAEGDDKPVKYPKAFIRTDLILLNKIDMLPYSDFDLNLFEERVRKINPVVKIIKLSARNGEGFETWIKWLIEIREKAGSKK